MRALLATVAIVAAALALPAGATAQKRTGQSPGCHAFCMSVEPGSAPEGSVFRFTGRGWRPHRRVRVNFGAYCRPGDPCIAILYTGLLRTDSRGRFTFRLRAGNERAGDEERGIRSGGRPTFQQRRSNGRTVSRSPRYRVILPD